MFITIDGPSGSGKSTQMHRIASRLKLEHIHIYKRQRALRVVTELIGKPTIYSDASCHLQALHAMKADNCVSDHFWEYLFPHFEYYEESLEESLPRVLTFLTAGLNVCGCKQPDASIILAVPWKVAYRRLAFRDCGVDVSDSGADIPDSPSHQKQMQFWRALETHLPYAHIVDGNRPPEEVTESIERLLN